MSDPDPGHIFLHALVFAFTALVVPYVVAGMFFAIVDKNKTIRLMKKLRHSRYFYLPAGFFGALTSIFMQSALEWVLKQQINFIWLVTMFAVISFLNKHYKDLIELENRKRAAAAEVPAEVKG